jgi:hypothetical protein
VFLKWTTNRDFIKRFFENFGSMLTAGSAKNAVARRVQRIGLAFGDF